VGTIIFRYDPNFKKGDVPKKTKISKILNIIRTSNLGYRTKDRKEKATEKSEQAEN